MKLDFDSWRRGGEVCGPLHLPGRGRAPSPDVRFGPPHLMPVMGIWTSEYLRKLGTKGLL